MRYEQSGVLNGGLLDEVESQIENVSGGDKKPVRNAIQEQLDRIPAGPLGKLGEGDLAGVVGYALIKSGQLAVLPIPGVRQPGFSVVSHGMEEMGEFQRHTIVINAAIERVATVASEYEIAAPSNIDYITSEVQTISVKTVTERPTYDTLEIVVDVADRGSTEV